MQPVNIEQLKIIHYPDPRLKAATRPVDTIDDNVRQVVRRMSQLMLQAPGVGLAAPQVGLDWQLFVAQNVELEDENQDTEPVVDVFINPKLTFEQDKPTPFEEGCLSVPGIYVQVLRPQAVTIEALDIDGNPFRRHSDDFAARIWQHEFDHLQGLTIVERMRMIDRLAHKRTLKQMELAYAEAHPDPEPATRPKKRRPKKRRK